MIKYVIFGNVIVNDIRYLHFLRYLIPAKVMSILNNIIDLFLCLLSFFSIGGRLSR